MGICRRFVRAAVVITLMFQVMMTGFGAISVCVDRPHTHAGVPAPDCPIHHQQSSVAPSHHEHHGHAQPGATSNSSRIACRCAGDPLSFLISDIGVLPDNVSVRVPTLPAGPISLVRPTTIDHRNPPPSPPPRPSLT
jgi:hypothetical protein